MGLRVFNRETPPGSKLVVASSGGLWPHVADNSHSSLSSLVVMPSWVGIRAAGSVPAYGGLCQCETTHLDGKPQSGCTAKEIVLQLSLLRAKGDIASSGYIIPLRTGWEVSMAVSMACGPRCSL